jgi:hypothetical protein
MTALVAWPLLTVCLVGAVCLVSRVLASPAGRHTMRAARASAAAEAAGFAADLLGHEPLPVREPVKPPRIPPYLRCEEDIETMADMPAASDLLVIP